MQLERFSIYEGQPVPDPTGHFVLFTDVITLVDAICTHIENGHEDDGEYTDHVWEQVSERDLVVAAEIQSIFNKDNEL